MGRAQAKPIGINTGGIGFLTAPNLRKLAVNNRQDIFVGTLVNAIISVEHTSYKIALGRLGNRSYRCGALSTSAVEGWIGSD